MRGSYFCGSSKLLTSSADWITVSSFGTAYPVPKSVSQSINQSVSQWQAGQGSFLILFSHHPPGLIFLGVLLVHVPRFSSTGTSTQVDMALPASERSIGWPPLTAAPLGYLHQLPARPDQNLSCSCSIRSSGSSACPARPPASQPADAERSNKGGHRANSNKVPCHDFMIRPRRQVAQRNSRDRLAPSCRPSLAQSCPPPPASSRSVPKALA